MLLRIFTAASTVHREPVLLSQKRAREELSQPPCLSKVIDEFCYRAGLFDLFFSTASQQVPEAS